MKSTVSHPVRLNACALAIFALVAGSAAAQSVISTNVTSPASPGYQIGATTLPSIVTIAPTTGTGVTFSGDAFLDNTGTTLRVGSTRDTVVGQFNVNGGSLGFTLSPNATATNPPNYSRANFDVKDGVGTGHLSVGSLVLTGGEKIGLTLTGSLRNGATSRLVTSGAAILTNGVSSPQYSAIENGNGQIADNSYVINSSVAVDTASLSTNLVYTAQRANNEYILKSATEGHFSNAAALTLGTIAAQGRQLGDLVTAINQIDIDGFGFGNNQANLAIQMKRLAPIANNAYAKTALASSDLMLSKVDDRLASLRGDIPTMKTVQHETSWLTGYVSTGKQTGFDNYDGYRSSTRGLALGFDRSMPDGWIGVAFSAAHSAVDQLDFRVGDQATLNHYQASFFAVREFGPMYIDGTLSGGRYELNGKRATAIGRTAEAQYTMYSMGMKSNIGYRFKLQDGKSVITPMVGLEVTSLNQPNYTETGAGDLGLEFDQKTYKRLRSKVGVRFNTESRFASKPSYTTVYMAYNHDSGLDNMDVRTSFSGTTDSQFTSFTTPAAELQRNMVQLGAGVTLALSKKNSLQLRYDLEHRQAFNSHAVQIKGVWKF